MYKRKTPLKDDCSIEKSLGAISGKWKPAILSSLLKGNIRLKEIQKGLPEASKRSLTIQLKEMIDDGLNLKKEYNQFPKKTVFSISNIGLQLEPVFNELSKFGDKL